MRSMVSAQMTPKKLANPMRYALVFIFALASIPAMALDVPVMVSQYEPIVVKHSVDTEIKVVPWGLAEPGFLNEEFVKRFSDHTVIGGPLGTYLIAGDGDLAWVVRGGIEPIPDPNPHPLPPDPDPPKPKPDPVPEPSVDIPGSWVLIVEESAERTIDMSRIVTDSTYWQTYVTRDLHWRVYDDDSPDAVSYLGVANEVGIPALIVLSPVGKVLAKQPLPQNTAAIDAIVKGVTGR